jgi:hypothetical protein
MDTSNAPKQSLYVLISEKPSIPHNRGLFWCARHGRQLGGESPLRAVVVGTASQRQGLYREVKTEGSLMSKVLHR